jgi:hypothetical protein
MRRIGLILIFLSLPFISSCVSQQQKDDSQRAYFDCLRKAAAGIDDGKSDALTVAVAIRPMCYSEYRTSVDNYTLGMMAAGSQRFEERIEQKRIEWETNIVMQNRAEKSHNTGAGISGSDETTKIIKESEICLKALGDCLSRCTTHTCMKACSANDRIAGIPFCKLSQ